MPEIVKKQDDPECISLLSEFLNRDSNLQIDPLEGKWVRTRIVSLFSLKFSLVAMTNVGDPAFMALLMSLMASRRANEEEAMLMAESHRADGGVVQLTDVLDSSMPG